MTNCRQRADYWQTYQEHLSPGTTMTNPESQHQATHPAKGAPNSPLDIRQTKEKKDLPDERGKIKIL